MSAPLVLFIYIGDLSGLGPRWETTASSLGKCQERAGPGMLFQDTVFVCHCSCGDPRSRRLVPSVRWGWGRREGTRLVLVGMGGSRGRGVTESKGLACSWSCGRWSGGGGLQEVPVAVPSGAAAWPGAEDVHLRCIRGAPQRASGEALPPASAYRAQLNLWQNGLSSSFGINVSFDLREGSAGKQPGARVAGPPRCSRLAFRERGPLRSRSTYPRFNGAAG